MCEHNMCPITVQFLSQTISSTLEETWGLFIRQKTLDYWSQGLYNAHIGLAIHFTFICRKRHPFFLQKLDTFGHFLEGQLLLYEVHWKHWAVPEHPCDQHQRKKRIGVDRMENSAQDCHIQEHPSSHETIQWNREIKENILIKYIFITTTYLIYWNYLDS